MRYNTQLNARIDPTTFKEVKALSKKRKQTISETVRALLEEALKRNQKRQAKVS